VERGPRIAIVGSRKLPRDAARRIIFGGVAGTPIDAVIVSGAARGPVRSRNTVSADREAARAARFYRRALDEMPADWDGLGRRAGFVRNVRLVESLTGSEDRLVAIHDGVSPGTSHVIAEARRAGKLGRVVTLRAGPGAGGAHGSKA
jgi:hypothetical protein